VLTPTEDLTMGRFIRMRDLVKMVPVSKAHIWRLVQAGKFPRPIKLSEKCTAWKVADIEDWLKAKEEAA